MTNAALGFGMLFQNGNGANPEVFTTVAGCRLVTPPSLTRDSVDASETLSPDQWREFIAGMKDAGEVSFEFHIVEGGASYEGLVAEFALEGANATKNRRVVFPGGQYWQFAAFCTGLEHDTPMDDAMVGTATFKVTGQPVLT